MLVDTVSMELFWKKPFTVVIPKPLSGWCHSAVSSLNKGNQENSPLFELRSDGLHRR